MSSGIDAYRTAASDPHPIGGNPGNPQITAPDVEMTAFYEAMGIPSPPGKLRNTIT